MKPLVELLTKIKERLNNRGQWDRSRIGGPDHYYDYGSLRYEIGRLIIFSDNNYQAAYNCVALAIISLLGPIKETVPVIIGTPVGDCKHFYPKEEDIRTLLAFEERQTHEDTMKVLELAIRYAKMYVFS